MYLSSISTRESKGVKYSKCFKMWQENTKQFTQVVFNACNAISEIHSLPSLESKLFQKNNEVNLDIINYHEHSLSVTEQICRKTRWLDRKFPIGLK